MRGARWAFGPLQVGAFRRFHRTDKPRPVEIPIELDATHRAVDADELLIAVAYEDDNGSNQEDYCFMILGSDWKILSVIQTTCEPLYGLPCDRAIERDKEQR